MTDADLAALKAIIARWAACECCDHRAPTDSCDCKFDGENRIMPLTPKERAERRRKR